MRVAFYDGGVRDVVPRVEDLAWPALVEMLTTHRESAGCAATPCPDRKCPSKLSFPAWSPVDIVGKRANDNVRAVTLGVFDLDHISDSQTEIFDALHRAGYTYALYSTHSSNPPDDICLRLVVPLSRPVLRSEWRRFWAAAVAELGIPGDQSCKDESRIFFLPDAPPGTSPVADTRDGRPLDVDALLASARAGAAARPTQAAQEPPPTDDAKEHPTDVHELAALLRRHARPENRALIGRVLRGEPLAARGQQDMTLQTLMSTVAFCLPNETADNAVVHVLRPCFAATDWGEGTEHLIGEALKKLHRSRERKIQRDSERLALNRAIRERLGMRESAPASAPSTLDEGEEDPDAWTGELITKEGAKVRDAVAGGDLKLLNCEANIELVLRCSPEWRDALRFNEVSKQLECANPPAGVGSTKAEGFDVELALWMQRSDWGRLGLMPKSRVMQDILRQTVRVSAYDPLREYLTGLQWDGVARVDSFLERYFGAEGDAPAYIRAVSRRWLISVVSRGLKPGEKVDTVLILEGPQGLKKSTAVEALSAPWFCDSKIDVTNKDTWMLAAQFWMIELAELEAMSSKTKETLKAFFSRRTDTFREPYGRVNATTPRRAIFVATTNSREYLQVDPSGYRRFLPINCTRIDVPALRQDRPQIFAEAVAMLQRGEQHWLTDDEAALAKVATAKRIEVADEVSEEMIREWITRLSPEKRPRKVTLKQVINNALMVPDDRVGTLKQREVADVLRAMGFEHVWRDDSTGKGRAWKVPESLVSAPQSIGGQSTAPQSGTQVPRRIG